MKWTKQRTNERGEKKATWWKVSEPFEGGNRVKGLNISQMREKGTQTLTYSTHERPKSATKKHTIDWIEEK